MNKKVVCITDIWNCSESITWKCPVKGEIYTIREIFEHPKTGIYCIRLVEIVNPVSSEVEPWFDLKGFREVDNTFGEEICTQLETEQEEEVKINIC